MPHDNFEPIAPTLVHRVIIDFGDMAFGELDNGGDVRSGTYIFIGKSSVEIDTPPFVVAGITVVAALTLAAMIALVVRSLRIKEVAN